MEERVELLDEDDEDTKARELLRSLQAGERGAADRLWERVERHAAPELRRRGVRNEDELLELLHAVFESAQRLAAQPGWRPRSNLAGFLKGRARGVFSVWAREQRRRRMNRRMEQLPGGLDDLAGKDAGPADAVARDDEREALGARIRHCRDRLDRRLYRPVWCLRYEAVQDLREIASSLGRPYETVAVQVHRANQQMRECLRAGGFEPWTDA